MTNSIAKIRAALEQACEYIRSDLASERGAFEGHEGVSRIDEIKADLASNAAALAALAELERAAATPRLWLAEPVSGDYAGYENDIVSAAAPEWAIKRAQRCYYAEFRAVPLYTVPPPAPVAEIRDVVVTDEMCDRAYIGKWRGVPELIGHEPDDEDRQWSREWLEAWRAELGPALGLVELRIYRETENARIAELEQDVTELQRIKQAAELVLRWDWSDNDDDCLDDMRELSKAIDKARAGNGGEG